MLGDESVVRRVAWSDLFAWLILVRCFRLAIRFRALVVAAVAILATLSGWAFLGMAFSSDPVVASQLKAYQGCPWRALTEMVPDRPFGTPEAGVPLRETIAAPARVPVFVRAWEPLLGSWEHLSRPWRELFTPDANLTQVVFLTLCGLWALLVWAFFGAAITRTTAVELAASERIGWGAMLRWAAAKWPSYVAAPLMPLLALGAAVLLSAVVGLLLRADVGVLIAAFAWPLMLLGWALVAVLLLGLLFGWPLMWPVISAEGIDSFDALSRTYSYLFSRPLHALFYTFVAMVLGLLGWILVSTFAATVVSLTYWGASWGSGGQAIHAIQTGGGLGIAGTIGAMLIRFSVECVKLLAIGFLYSYLWTAATAIYLLLRRDVDAREMDEVFLEDAGATEIHSLPALRTDESGVPEMADDIAGGSGPQGETNAGSSV